MVWFGMVSFVSFSCQFANPADMQLAMPPLVPQRAYCSCCLISFPFPAQGRLVPVTTSHISEHPPLLPRLHVPLPPSPTPCLAPPLLKLLPRNLAKLAQRLELPIPQPHTRRPQDPRVHRQRVAHRLVRRHARVVPQRKVVAARVPDLVAADGRGEHEDAPVVDVADDAAVAEDELAGCEDDSGGRGGLVLSSSRVVGGVFERGGGCSGGSKGGIYSLTSARLPGRAWWSEQVSCSLDGRGGEGKGTNNADNLVQHGGGQRLSPGCCVSIAGED